MRPRGESCLREIEREGGREPNRAQGGGDGEGASRGDADPSHLPPHGAGGRRPWIVSGRPRSMGRLMHTVIHPLSLLDWVICCLHILHRLGLDKIDSERGKADGVRS